MPCKFQRKQFDNGHWEFWCLSSVVESIDNGYSEHEGTWDKPCTRVEHPDCFRESIFYFVKQSGMKNVQEVEKNGK